MLQSKSEGPLTFTSRRILQVLRDERNSGEPRGKWWPREFYVYRFETTLEDDGFLSVPPRSERQISGRSWCIKLQAHIKDHSADFAALDMCFSELLECHFLPKNDDETVVRGVCNMLTRMPETPLELHDALIDPPYHEIQRPHFMEDFTPAWENLLVARFVSRNAIRMAIQIQIALAGEFIWNPDFQDFLNTTAEALQAAIQLSTEQSSTEWFMVKSFLWTSWQQSVILCHYYVLEKQLSDGWRQYKPVTSPLEGSEIMLNALRSERNKIEMEIPSYMCKLFQRFSQSFSNYTPRCMISGQGLPQSCNGKRPEQCLRLSGMKIENQSAHAYDCNKNCRRLYWNEDSWKAIGGAAAVLLDLRTDGLLGYCESSKRTMAVSHVWSHGQGGRPENDAANEGTGLNSCLHRRYANIANSYGCDSYWMDTPCIPTDHNLRRQAIANINRVFANSKLTLVCDRDLMTIDVSKPDIAVQESILATILVCGWNVRAWTLLEALRGRENTHLLCKDDLTISLQKAVEDVSRRGCIDIAVLFLSAQHLLPMPSSIPEIWGNRLQHEFQEDDRNKRIAYVNITEAAGLLSLRHASRLGDEIVIWSLLFGDDASFTANELWQKQMGSEIPTGFPMSNLPRLSNEKGFSWAPCRPNFPLIGGNPNLDYDEVLFSYSGEGSELARISLEGLHGYWYARKFEVPAASDDGEGSASDMQIAFLQPLSDMSSIESQPHPPWKTKNLYVSVFSEDGQAWRWGRLFAIDDSTALPEFKAMEFIIV